MVIKELLSSSSMLCRMMIKLLNFTNHRSKNNDNTATTKKKNPEKRVKRILYIKNHQAIQTTANKCKYASLHRMYTFSLMILWSPAFFLLRIFFSLPCVQFCWSVFFSFFSTLCTKMLHFSFFAKHFMDNERKFVFIFIVSVVVAVFVITCCIEMARI